MFSYRTLRNSGNGVFGDVELVNGKGSNMQGTKNSRQLKRLDQFINWVKQCISAKNFFGYTIRISWGVKGKLSYRSVRLSSN